MSPLRFLLLGPLEARRDDTALDLGPRKQRAVLALLLLNANRVVPTERLIDDLWGESPPETARSALQVYVAGLRKALGPDGAVLRTAAPGYVLDVPPGSLDLDRFKSLRAEARAATDSARKAELLHGALALWRGGPLAELGSEPFAPAAAAQLEQLRLGALEERIDADLALGRHAQLLPELNGLVAEHPYHEPFRAQLMLALYRAGRQADALAAYRAAREDFMDGLGLEPGPDLKALERAVLEQDPALGGPAAPPQTGEEPPQRRRRPWILAAALGVLAVAAVVAAAVLLREESTITVPPNSLAVIDPATNDVTGVVPVGVGPGPIAAGGGALWVGTLDKTLQRVDPGALAVAKTFSLGATPTGVAFGADAAWVAHGLTGEVSRVDPQLEGVTKTQVAQTRLLSTGAVAYGAGPSGPSSATRRSGGSTPPPATSPNGRTPPRGRQQSSRAAGTSGWRASGTPRCTATHLRRSSKGRSAGRALEAARRQSRTVTASSGSPARATTWSLASTLGTTRRSRSPSATDPSPSRSVRAPCGSRTRATEPSRASTPRRAMSRRSTSGRRRPASRSATAWSG